MSDSGKWTVPTLESIASCFAIATTMTAVATAVGTPVFLHWRSHQFAKLLRTGKFAVSPDFAKTKFFSDLATEIPDAPAVLLVGTKGIGKSFSASHWANKRQNAIFIQLTSTLQLSPDNVNVLTPEKVLEFLYDYGTEQTVTFSFLPAWIDVPARQKKATMTSILKRATVNGQCPTLVFDVHSGSTIDAFGLLGALKVLTHDLQLVKVILTATEGMEFSKTNDDRWMKVIVTEVKKGVAETFLSKSLQFDAQKVQKVMLQTPLTAYNLTQSYDRMIKASKANAIRFLTAMSVACPDEKRASFAQQALKGFGDPAETALHETFKEKAGGSDKVDQWFHAQFVKTNVMAKYGDTYEFQFESTRHLAQKLVDKKGNLDALEEELRKEGWV
jgi:hypothetical protein